MNKFFDYNLVCDIQAGASVGGLIGLLIIIGVIIFFVILIRRRRHAESFIKKEVELSLFSFICFHFTTKFDFDKRFTFYQLFYREYYFFFSKMIFLKM